MIIRQSDKNYPRYVCAECGFKASVNMGNDPVAFRASTFHTGICDICGKEGAITEPRDFFYPDFHVHTDVTIEWHKYDNFKDWALADRGGK